MLDFNIFSFVNILAITLQCTYPVSITSNWVVVNGVFIVSVRVVSGSYFLDAIIKCRSLLFFLKVYFSIWN